jgi:protein dithiol:quinone oxidoreductase
MVSGFPKHITTGHVFGMLCAVCFGLLGFGLYLQHGVGLEPCPMCIMQRYALLGVGLLCFVAALHRPHRMATRIYGLGVVVLSGTGASIAARQSWLQWNPPAFAECGPDLPFLLGRFPLNEALPLIFKGTGDCSVIDWTFLGLSIANWSFLNFAWIFLVGLCLVWCPSFFRTRAV